MKKFLCFLGIACFIGIFLYQNLVTNVEPTANPSENQSSSDDNPTIESTNDKVNKPTEEQTKAPTDDEIIESYLNDMTLEEKVGQLLMADFRQDASGNNITALDDKTAAATEQYNIGGVILFAENINTEEQTKTLIADLQALSKTPLLIGVDEEGGIVSRLSKSQIEHTIVPSASTLNTAEKAENAGTNIGLDLANLGFNVDFAPVADVNTNPQNPVIGSRAFSSDPQIAGKLVASFIEAMQKEGISACAKHFPGHGDTQNDTHSGYASASSDIERLKSVEFVPFKSAIEADVDMIMVSHITLPNVTDDGLPASLSHDIISLLRDELSYDGIAITDAMNMQAITKYYNSGDAALMAIKAGIDIVLMPEDLDLAYNTILSAVQNGEISQERIDQSVWKIIELKHKKGLI